jgi:hypothetical protein
MDELERPEIKQFNDLLKALSDPCEERVYHYTSASGLRGIIENHEIWLTNTEFVNDISECKTLHEQKTFFDEYFSEVSNKDVIDSWENFKRQPHIFNNYYIASFSKKRNSLEQYRAYGSFCICFETDKFVKRGFSQFECIYDISKIGEWIVDKSRVPEWDLNCFEAQYKRSAAEALIFAASVKCKNNHYKAEEEVRLFTVSNHQYNRKGLLKYSNDFYRWVNEPSIYFREHIAFATPVPYVKFIIPDKAMEVGEKNGAGEETLVQMKERKLKEEKDYRRQRLPIKEVQIGPMLHQKEAKVAVEILLCEKGYEDTLVTISDIPYRGF